MDPGCGNVRRRPRMGRGRAGKSSRMGPAGPGTCTEYCAANTKGAADTHSALEAVEEARGTPRLTSVRSRSLDARHPSRHQAQTAALRTAPAATSYRHRVVSRRSPAGSGRAGCGALPRSRRSQRVLERAGAKKRSRPGACAVERNEVRSEAEAPGAVGDGAEHGALRRVWRRYGSVSARSHQTLPKLTNGPSFVEMRVRTW